MSTQRQNDDGSWSEAEPLPYFPGLDFECYTIKKNGVCYRWVAYDQASCVGCGTTRTKLGRWWEMFQFRHFWESVDHA